MDARPISSPDRPLPPVPRGLQLLTAGIRPAQVAHGPLPPTLRSRVVGLQQALPHRIRPGVTHIPQAAPIPPHLVRLHPAL